jgi:hypothetical protein
MILNDFQTIPSVAKPGFPEGLQLWPFDVGQQDPFQFSRARSVYGGTPQEKSSLPASSKPPDLNFALPEQPLLPITSEGLNRIEGPKLQFPYERLPTRMAGARTSTSNLSRLSRWLTVGQEKDKPLGKATVIPK